jgi:hypothetical protein
MRSTLLTVVLLWLESEGRLGFGMWLFAALMLMVFLTLDGKDVDTRAKAGRAADREVVDG